MNVKQILFYCDEYPPAKSGGIGSVTKIVAEALAATDRQISIAGNYEYGSIDMKATVINGVKIYRFPYFTFLRFFPAFSRRFVKAGLRKTGILSKIAAKDLQRNEQKIAELIRFLDIEIIELVDYISLLKEIKQPISLQKFEIPSTLRIHGSVSFLNLNKGISNIVQLENDRKNFERANKLTAVSKYAANFVNDQILSVPREIEVIYNPIENDLLNGYSDASNNTILFFGKITETKGAFQALKAFQTIASEFPLWNMKLLGGGEIEQAEKSIKLANKDRIKFLGYVNRTDVISSIETCDFVVIPSYFENFSMAPLEVMAKRKALIYTSRTSGPEIITDGVNGFLVEPNDIIDIENKMRQLILNPELRNKLANAGFETVSRSFTVERILLQLQSHYNSLKYV